MREVEMNINVNVIGMDKDGNWEGEEWTCGDLKSDSAQGLAEAILAEIELEAGDAEDYRTKEDCEYVNYEVVASIGDAEVARANAWTLAGYVAPGASMDLDGSGLTNWGDSQHGEWSVVLSDGQSRGPRHIGIGRHRAFLRDIRPRIRMVERL